MSRHYSDELRQALLSTARGKDLWMIRAIYLVALLKLHGIDAAPVLKMSKEEVANRLLKQDYSGFEPTDRKETPHE
jgi:hypothetical protein